jgi:hypothetical protein
LKNVQHSLNGFAFRSTPPFHHHSIIHPVLFILQGAAAISVKYTRIRKSNTAQLIMIRFY